MRCRRARPMENAKMPPIEPMTPAPIPPAHLRTAMLILTTMRSVRSPSTEEREP